MENIFNIDANPNQYNEQTNEEVAFNDKFIKAINAPDVNLGTEENTLPDISDELNTISIQNNIEEVSPQEDDVTQEEGMVGEPQKKGNKGINSGSYFSEPQKNRRTLDVVSALVNGLTPRDIINQIRQSGEDLNYNLLTIEEFASKYKIPKEKAKEIYAKYILPAYKDIVYQDYSNYPYSRGMYPKNEYYESLGYPVNVLPKYEKISLQKSFAEGEYYNVISEEALSVNRGVYIDRYGELKPLSMYDKNVNEPLALKYVNDDYGVILAELPSAYMHNGKTLVNIKSPRQLYTEESGISRMFPIMWEGIITSMRFLADEIVGISKYNIAWHSGGSPSSHKIANSGDIFTGQNYGAGLQKFDQRKKEIETYKEKVAEDGITNQEYFNAMLASLSNEPMSNTKFIAYAKRDKMLNYDEENLETARGIFATAMDATGKMLPYITSSIAGSYYGVPSFLSLGASILPMSLAGAAEQRQNMLDMGIDEKVANQFYWATFGIESITEFLGGNILWTAPKKIAIKNLAKEYIDETIEELAKKEGMRYVANKAMSSKAKATLLNKFYNGATLYYRVMDKIAKKNIYGRIFAGITEEVIEEGFFNPILYNSYNALMRSSYDNYVEKINSRYDGVIHKLGEGDDYGKYYRIQDGRKEEIEEYEYLRSVGEISFAEQYENGESLFHDNQSWFKQGLVGGIAAVPLGGVQLIFSAITQKHKKEYRDKLAAITAELIRNPQKKAAIYNAIKEETKKYTLLDKDGNPIKNILVENKIELTDEEKENVDDNANIPSDEINLNTPEVLAATAINDIEFNVYLYNKYKNLYNIAIAYTGFYPSLLEKLFTNLGRIEKINNALNELETKGQIEKEVVVSPHLTIKKDTNKDELLKHKSGIERLISEIASPYKKLNIGVDKKEHSIDVSKAYEDLYNGSLLLDFFIKKHVEEKIRNKNNKYDDLSREEKGAVYAKELEKFMRNKYSKDAMLELTGTIEYASPYELLKEVMKKVFSEDKEGQGLLGAIDTYNENNGGINTDIYINKANKTKSLIDELKTKLLNLANTKDKNEYIGILSSINDISEELSIFGENIINTSEISDEIARITQDLQSSANEILNIAYKKDFEEDEDEEYDPQADMQIEGSHDIIDNILSRLNIPISVRPKAIETLEDIKRFEEKILSGEMTVADVFQNAEYRAIINKILAYAVDNYINSILTKEDKNSNSSISINALYDIVKNDNAGLLDALSVLDSVKTLRYILNSLNSYVDMNLHLKDAYDNKTKVLSPYYGKSYLLFDKNDDSVKNIINEKQKLLDEIDKMLSERSVSRKHNDMKLQSQHMFVNILSIESILSRIEIVEVDDDGELKIKEGHNAKELGVVLTQMIDIIELIKTEINKFSKNNKIKYTYKDFINALYKINRLEDVETFEKALVEINKYLVKLYSLLPELNKNGILDKIVSENNNKIWENTQITESNLLFRGDIFDNRNPDNHITLSYNYYESNFSNEGVNRLIIDNVLLYTFKDLGKEGKPTIYDIYKVIEKINNNAKDKVIDYMQEYVIISMIANYYRTNEEEKLNPFNNNNSYNIKRAFVVDGRPGTGKTEVVQSNYIKAISLLENKKLKLRIVTPNEALQETYKSIFKDMKEYVDSVEYSTYTTYIKDKITNGHDIIIFDEHSIINYVDGKKIVDILKADNSHKIFIGDDGQFSNIEELPNGTKIKEKKTQYALSSTLVAFNFNERNVIPLSSLYRFGELQNIELISLFDNLGINTFKQKVISINTEYAIKENYNGFNFKRGIRISNNNNVSRNSNAVFDEFIDYFINLKNKLNSISTKDIMLILRNEEEAEIFYNYAKFNSLDESLKMQIKSHIKYAEFDINNPDKFVSGLSSNNVFVYVDFNFNNSTLNSELLYYAKLLKSPITRVVKDGYMHVFLDGLTSLSTNFIKTTINNSLSDKTAPFKAIGNTNGGFDQKKTSNGVRLIKIINYDNTKENKKNKEEAKQNENKNNKSENNKATGDKKDDVKIGDNDIHNGNINILTNETILDIVDTEAFAMFMKDVEKAYKDGFNKITAGYNISDIENLDEATLNEYRYKLRNNINRLVFILKAISLNNAIFNTKYKHLITKEVEEFIIKQLKILHEIDNAAVDKLLSLGITNVTKLNIDFNNLKVYFNDFLYDINGHLLIPFVTSEENKSLENTLIANVFDALNNEEKLLLEKFDKGEITADDFVKNLKISDNLKKIIAKRINEIKNKNLKQIFDETTEINNIKNADDIINVFAKKISNATGATIVNISEEEAIALGYEDARGFFNVDTNTAYFVNGKSNVLTTIHEAFSKPFIIYIKQHNRRLYDKLLNEAKRNKEVYDFVKTKYSGYIGDALDYEYIARSIDMYSKKYLQLKYAENKTLINIIKNFFYELINFIKETFKIGSLYNGNISENLSLNKLSLYIVYSKKYNINLKGNISTDSVVNHISNKDSNINVDENFREKIDKIIKSRNIFIDEDVFKSDSWLSLVTNIGEEKAFAILIYNGGKLPSYEVTRIIINQYKEIYGNKIGLEDSSLAEELRNEYEKLYPHIKYIDTSDPNHIFTDAGEAMYNEILANAGIELINNGTPEDIKDYLYYNTIPIKTQEYILKEKSLNNLLEYLATNLSITEQTQLAILNNENIDKTVLLNLAANRSITEKAQLAILNNKNVDETVLRNLAKNQSITEQTQLAILNNENIDKTVLLNLAANRSITEKAQLAILNNKNVSRNVLRNLAYNRSITEKAQLAILNNEKFNEDVLLNLAYNLSITEKAQLAILNNKNVDETVLRNLAMNTSITEKVQLAILNNEKFNEDVLLNLAYNLSITEKVQLAILNNENVSRNVLLNLAYNTSIKEKVLLAILNKENINEAVFHALAANQLITEKAQLAILNNKNVDETVLRNLAKNQSITEQTQLAILNNENFDETVLRNLAMNTSITEKIQLAILNNEKINEDVLINLTNNRSLTGKVVLAILKHELLSKDVIYTLLINNKNLINIIKDNISEIIKHKNTLVLLMAYFNNKEILDSIVNNLSDENKKLYNLILNIKNNTAEINEVINAIEKNDIKINILHDLESKYIYKIINSNYNENKDIINKIGNILGDKLNLNEINFNNENSSIAKYFSLRTKEKYALETNNLKFGMRDAVLSYRTDIKFMLDILEYLNVTDIKYEKLLTATKIVWDKNVIIRIINNIYGNDVASLIKSNKISITYESLIEKLQGTELIKVDTIRKTETTMQSIDKQINYAMTIYIDEEYTEEELEALKVFNEFAYGSNHPVGFGFVLFNFFGEDVAVITEVQSDFFQQEKNKNMLFLLEESNAINGWFSLHAKLRKYKNMWANVAVKEAIRQLHKMGYKEIYFNSPTGIRQIGAAPGDSVIKEVYEKLPKTIGFGEIVPKTFNNIKIDVYDKIGKKSLENILFKKVNNVPIGVSDIKAGVVLIDAVLSNNPLLITHEYVHHYIRMFINSKIVRDGIKLFGSEENLVDAISKEVVRKKGKGYNWWVKFRDWLFMLFSTEKRLLNNLTNKFMNNVNINDVGVNIKSEQELKNDENFNNFIQSAINVDTNTLLKDMVKSGEIIYTDDNNNICAAVGGKTAKIKKGLEWTIVADLGKQNFSKGGKWKLYN